VTIATPAEREVIPSAWLTPRPGRELPIHRWFAFPHSFAPQLVEWLITELELGRRSLLLDPFCGAGTTLVEAQRLGLTPIGVDLLPLAILASQAKVLRPSASELRRASSRAIAAALSAPPLTAKSPLLKRALTRTVYGRLRAALLSARGPASHCVKLAVLSIAPRFSSLAADGGWLREVEPRLDARQVSEALAAVLLQMTEDLRDASGPTAASVYLADARALPLDDESIDGVITSPPYPNRHDYTRVFSVELELGFSLGDSVKQLRYSAIHSHPEARPQHNTVHYESPPGLSQQVAAVDISHRDSRIPRMLSGYFRDLYLVLIELGRVLRTGGPAALVVGNVQYCGVAIPVDRHLAHIAQRAGFRLLDIVPLRLRGNSAQQMATFGRRDSRESVVLLQRPPHGRGPLLCSRAS
jgi:DNA modification methylase